MQRSTTPIRMEPRALLSFSAALFFVPAFTQAPAIQWQKCLGGGNWEVGYTIQQTSDGGYIVVGTTFSSNGDVSGWHGGTDTWVVKLDAAGNITWQRCLGGNSDELEPSIQQTSDGGYIVAGRTYSNNGDVSGNHGDYDAWVVKLDAAGDISWQKCLGGSNSDGAYSIKQTTDGGAIVAGSTVSNDGDVSGNHGDGDSWVVKLDVAGNITWQKCLGGSSSDYASSIQQTSDGGYIVGGYTLSNDGDVSGNHSVDLDLWVVKLDAAGDISWQKCLGGSNGEWEPSIQQTTDGGAIVAGWTQSNDGDVSGNDDWDHDLWVVKLEAAGDISWQKCLGGSNYEFEPSIQQTSDGGYIVAAETGSTDGDVSGNHGNVGMPEGWVVKLDAIGDIAWQKCLGGSDADAASSIQQTSDGGYIVAGETGSTDGDASGNHGALDLWVVKLEGESTGMSSGSGRSGAFSLWPNPNDGQELWLSIPVMPGATKVAAEIHDLAGKRVLARTVTMRGGEACAPLELNGLAPGTYTASIVADGQRSTLPLLIEP